MEFLMHEEYDTLVAEAPDKQPPATSYPEPGQTAPMNPTPDVPGTDAPEVSTGSRATPEEPAQETDEDQVGAIESENP